MFISFYVCLDCTGRVVTKVVRTCDPTPLLYQIGNKICLNYCVYGLFRVIMILKNHICIRELRVRVRVVQRLLWYWRKCSLGLCGISSGFLLLPKYPFAGILHLLIILEKFS